MGRKAARLDQKKISPRCQLVQLSNIAGLEVDMTNHADAESPRVGRCLRHAYCASNLLFASHAAEL
jgi:hypothetical protein